MNKGLKSAPWELLAPETADHHVGVAYLALPSRRQPRWVVPLENQKAAQRSLDLYSPSRTYGRIYQTILRGMTRIGPLLKTRLVYLETTRRTALSEYIHSQYETDSKCHIAISCGTNWARQKFTLQIMDNDGVPIAYLKVSVNPLGHSSLRTEADMLASLESRGGGLMESIPRLHGLHEHEDMLVLAQSAGPTMPSPQTLTPDHWDFLCLLIEDDILHFPQDFVAQHNLHERVRESGSTLSSEHALTLKIALDHFLTQPTTTLRACTVHGDFAPWNIRCLVKQDEKQFFVFDWEQGFENGIPLYDAFHFAFQTGVLVHDMKPPTLLRALHILLKNEGCQGYLDAVGVTEGQALQLFRAYLLGTALDAIELGETPTHSQLLHTRLECLALLQREEL